MPRPNRGDDGQKTLEELMGLEENLPSEYCFQVFVPVTEVTEEEGSLE